MGCCVYEHWRPDTNACFYVGKGALRRSRDLGVSAGCRTKAHGAVQEALRAQGLQVEIRIVAQDLTELEALALEMERIALYGKIEDGGTLVNRTIGGSGTYGMRHTPEARAKMCAAQAARDPALSGHPHTPESRAKISAALKGRPKSAESRAKRADTLRGRPLTPEHIANIKAAQKARWARRRERLAEGT
nr:NUMOD3 domain-containing DNA-binding protein [Mesorhizobium sp.]